MNKELGSHSDILGPYPVEFPLSGSVLLNLMTAFHTSAPSAFLLFSAFHHFPPQLIRVVLTARGWNKNHTDLWP